MSKPYSIGFGKPPKATRFKSGKSGNLKGRPKGTRNLKTDLEDELQQTVAISVGGRKRRISKQQVMIKTLFGRVAQGDVRAINLLINLILKITNPSAQPADAANISNDDRQIIENFLARHVAKPPKAKEKTHE